MGNEIQTQINNTLSQLNSLNLSGSIGTNSGNNSKFVNSIYSLINEGQAALNGNDNEKAQAITNIVQNLLSAVMSLGTGETQKATTETKKQESEIDKNKNESNQISDSLKSKIEEITAQIGNKTVSISQALTEIEKLGGDGGEIAKAQEELEKQVQIIEENKEIINDGVSNPEAKKAALNNLLMAASAINGLVEKVISLQAVVEKQNEIVETASDDISGLIEESATTIEDSAIKLQENLQKAGQQQAKVATTELTGKANVKVGEEVVEAGTESSIIPGAGAVASSKLIPIGTDQINAGNVRTSNSAKNLQNISSVIGQIGTEFNKFGTYLGSISNIGSEAANLVGQYNAKLPSIIESIGSWTEVANVNAQFEQEIERYSQIDNASTNTESDTNNTSSYTNEIYKVNQNDWTKFNPLEKEAEKEDSSKFNFDTNLFRKPFEKASN